MLVQPQQPTKRIEYIDALRGITMILVVFSHVELFGFYVDEPTLLNSLFISFRMPLFFFISGFIAYKASIEWNLQTWWAMSKKKILVQLVPTLFFGMIYTYLYYNTDIYTFITRNGKLGYWFTIVLLEIFLITYTIKTCLYRGNLQKYNKRVVGALVATSALLYLLKLVLKANPTLNEVGNIFSLHHTFNYFQYFAFGHICAMYKNKFHDILGNKQAITGIISLYALLFCAQRFYISQHVGNSINIWKIAETLTETIVGYLGILIVYNTFRTYQDAFSNKTKVGASLQYIGKRTLDIYLLHSFFIPHLPQWGGFFNENKNLAIELVANLGISLTIICICLGISNILRTSPMLAKLLFGVSTKKG